VFQINENEAKGRQRNENNGRKRAKFRQKAPLSICTT
jgi:hypothetical protein